MRFKIDRDRLTDAWRMAGYTSLKDVFRDNDVDRGNENGLMRYDSANKAINTGWVSYAVISYLSNKLNCPIEYLRGNNNV